MRIALACHNFPPEFTGGTERVVAALARALTASGDEVVVVTGSEAPHAGRDVVAETGLGIDVRRLPRHRDEVYGLDLRRPRVLTLVEDLLMETGAEVLHVHHWSALSVRLVRSARVLGLGTVVTLHDMWTSCGRFFRRPPEGILCPSGAGRAECVPCGARDLPIPPERIARGIWYRDREIAAELAAAHTLTAPSASCAALVREHVPWSGPVEVVPHGLLEPVGRGHDRERPARPFRVGTFGNLLREKGVSVLLEAMAGVPVAELHLHGPVLQPAYQQELLARAQQLGVRLHLHGAYRAETEHPAEHLDLAVFPSLCAETYGLVVEEALARGVPVVVSALGALSERIGGAGVVVPAGEVRPLRAAIQRLVQQPAAYAQLVAAIPAEFPTIATAAARYREFYARARQQVSR